ncbi:MAG TPA: NHLP leader peptide family RiPP precursor [Chloroflexota bacterium]|jgi:hypothetical protein
MAMDPAQRQEHEKRYGQVVARAWRDDAFKQRLMSDPKNALKEHGIQVGDHTEVRVVENTKNVVHVVLPPKPGALSDEQLDQVAGGQGSCVVTECDICATE